MKKSICIISAVMIAFSALAVALFSASATNNSQSIDSEIFGDIDGDGIVTVVDATFIQRHSANIETPYPLGEQVSYNNIYNVTVTPSITADTNNFLASSGNTSDRSFDIAAMLAQTGCCILGSGDFYVSGVELPEGASIRGQGNSTRVIWINGSADNNYIFKLNSKCTLSDMTILGQTKDRTSEVRSKDIGSLSGVLIEGNYDNSTSIVNGPVKCLLSGLLISNIAGCGIKISRTGMSPEAHTQIDNCNVTQCDCGIFSGTFSEFNMFSNVASQRNYYGVISKGGNNRFTNCDFCLNDVGVYLACTDEPNNSHGIFVGCEIAHSNSGAEKNEGYALICEGVSSGERFDACTIAFGKILIKDSVGVKFTNSGVTKTTVELENSTGFVMNGCSLGRVNNFHITETGKNINTHIIDCYTIDGIPFTYE